MLNIHCASISNTAQSIGLNLQYCLQCMGKQRELQGWKELAQEEEQTRFRQESCCKKQQASKGHKFTGSECLSMFKQRHGFSSSHSYSRSRSHSQKHCPHQAHLAQSAAATTSLAQHRSRATVTAAATAETTASTTTAEGHLELQTFWSGRPSEVTTVAASVEWQKSQGVTNGI